MMVHENTAGYSCPMCEYIAKRGDDVRKHLRRKHKRQTIPDRGNWTKVAKRDNGFQYVYKLSSIVKFHPYPATKKELTETFD